MKMNEMRALVTGGLGFIGSHLVRELLAEGAKVSVIDSGNNTLRLRDIENRIDLHVSDLSDKAELAGILKAAEPELIFHLGAFTTPGRDRKYVSEAFRKNVLATVNLLEALSGADFRSMVFPSCSEVYGPKNKVPFREDMVPLGTSPYSTSKLACEYYCLLYHGTYSYPVTVLRPFNVYGPMQSPKLLVPQAIVSCLKKQDFLMTKGMQTREFNYVEDTVKAFVLASLNKQAAGEIINIGCGKDHEIKHVVEMIASIFGNPVKILDTLPYRENEVWKMRSDSSKAEKILKWKPETALEEGLEKTIRWYRQEWANNPGSIYFAV